MTAAKPDYLQLAGKPDIKFEEECCTGNCSYENFNPYIKHQESCPPQILKTKKQMENAGVNKRIIEVLFNNNLQETKVFKYACKYLEKDFLKGKSLVLSAPTGTGKTTASSYLIKKLEYGRSVYAPDLPGIFLNEDKFNNLKSMKFLIIDDLGLEYRKDWFYSNFDSLIHYRHGSFLPTVLTTNLSGDEFKEIYSERIISRLREWGQFIQLKDIDHRKKI